MSNFIVVAYYTKNTLYEEHSRKLISSLNNFNVPYYIEEIENLGDWNKNTHYKPTFLKDMLIRHNPKPIVYVDVDALFFRYPVLFDNLTCDFAAHMLDHHPWKPGVKRTELLSGTLYIGNTEKGLQIISKWIDGCKTNLKAWDQKILQSIIGDDFYKLPQEYCVIFDDKVQPKEPVIVHYQASREVRKNGLK